MRYERKKHLNTSYESVEMENVHLINSGNEFLFHQFLYEPNFPFLVCIYLFPLKISVIFELTLYRNDELWDDRQDLHTTMLQHVLYPLLC
jgi:hypothetical protein